MNISAFNRYCGQLPATTTVVQWGGSHVWKVGGKLFALAVVNDGAAHITFKVSPLAFEILQHQAGLRGAPYLASRGMMWIQHYAKPGLSDADLKDHIRQSHRLVALGLSKKRQTELGLTVALQSRDR